MHVSDLIQLAASAAAVALLVGLAALATRGRGAPGLDDVAARRRLAEEYPGARIDGLWLAADGQGALARSGDHALVLSPMGVGYAARRIPWDTAVRAPLKDGRLSLPLADFAAPRAVLQLNTWPPKNLAV